MLYTSSPSPDQGGHVTLFFSPGEARDADIEGRTLYAVSVHYDALMKRLIPTGSLDRGVGRDWSTVAEWPGLGQIVARGPIQEPLVFRWVG